MRKSSLARPAPAARTARGSWHTPYAPIRRSCRTARRLSRATRFRDRAQHLGGTSVRSRPAISSWVNQRASAVEPPTSCTRGSLARSREPGRRRVPRASRSVIPRGRATPRRVARDTEQLDQPPALPGLLGELPDQCRRPAARRSRYARRAGATGRRRDPSRSGEQVPAGRVGGHGVRGEALCPVQPVSGRVPRGTTGSPAARPAAGRRRRGRSSALAVNGRAAARRLRRATSGQVGRLADPVDQRAAAHGGRVQEAVGVDGDPRWGSGAMSACTSTSRVTAIDSPVSAAVSRTTCRAGSRRGRPRHRAADQMPAVPERGDARTSNTWPAEPRQMA